METAVERVPQLFFFLKKVLRFIKEDVLLYQHIIEKTLRQKHVQNGNQKPPKIEIFGGRISVRHKQLFLAMVYYIFFFLRIYAETI